MGRGYYNPPLPKYMDNVLGSKTLAAIEKANRENLQTLLDFAVDYAEEVYGDTEEYPENEERFIALVSACDSIRLTYKLK